MKHLVILLLFLVPGLLFSFQWPLKNPVLIVTFAEDIDHSFSEGVDLASSQKTVHPISQGEVVFYHKEKNRQNDIPAPLGNLIVLQHRRGLYSFYAHLENINVDDTNFLVTENTSLGSIGTSGISRGQSLFFALLDGEFDQFVNPLLSLPPIQDTERPEIGSLFLSTPHSREKVVKGKTVTSGTYTAAVEIRDFSNNVTFYCPLAPYSIDLYVNGELKKSIKFEFLTLKAGRRVLQNTLLSFSDLYKGPWLFSAGSLDIPPGDTRIELSVKDFEGNETIKIFRIKSVE